MLRHDEEVLEKFMSLARAETGNVFGPDKRDLVSGRVSKLLRSSGEADASVYLKRVRSDAAELCRFIDAVTTHETSFFRTPAVWRFLEGSLAAPRPPGRHTTRLWSAASSTGEEPYSIALTCEEHREKAGASFSYEITATDVAAETVARARAGTFRGRSEEKLRRDHPALAAKYFTSEGGALTATPRLRSKITFSSHNLLRPAPPGGPFDFIFLRNVLIYFSDADCRKIVGLAASKLAPGGALVLGESESITEPPASLRYEAPMIFRRTDHP